MVALRADLARVRGELAGAAAEARGVLAGREKELEAQVGYLLVCSTYSTLVVLQYTYSRTYSTYSTRVVLLVVTIY